MSEKIRVVHEMDRSGTLIGKEIFLRTKDNHLLSKSSVLGPRVT